MLYERCVIVEDVKQYLISIAAAAILSAIVTSFFKSGANGKLIKMTCSVLVSITVLQPFIKLRLPDLNHYFRSVSAEASQSVDDGIYQAAKAERAGIKQRVEAYILNKAAQYDCELEVIATLSEESPYQPVGVQIRGEVSPYAKAVLSETIAQSLGIAKEDQEWN